MKEGEGWGGGEEDLPAEVERREDLIDGGAGEPALEGALPDEIAAMAGVGGECCHGERKRVGMLFRLT